MGFSAISAISAVKMCEMLSIIQAEIAERVAQACELFQEYESWLGMSLCFQGFDAELATLPGKYAPPKGRLLLAYNNNELAGCVALRPLSVGDICEMKRLFVRDAFRGKRVGISLIERVIDDAREIGYTKMRLDTHPEKMAKAVKLYRSHGFIEIAPYYENPHDGVLFMELSL